jgi:two-component system, cell cycle sensor histidine kinase and response regulator CckA
VKTLVSLPHPWSTTGRFAGQPLGWRAPDHERTAGAIRTGAILVVDDDRRVRRLTARMLEEEGFSVYEAGSGREALRAVSEHPEIRLLLTDIAMPEMHGLELARQVADQAPHLRVVLMTGHAPELFTQLTGPDQYFPILLKPFNADRLIQQVEEALRGRSR